jgi:hypothetical protein
LLAAVCGWATLYLAIGGALGHALCSTSSCNVRGAAFVNLHGSSGWVFEGLLAMFYGFWTVGVFIPRILLLPLAASVPALLAFPMGLNPNGSDLLIALAALCLSLPALLLIGFGIPYWWRRDRLIATGAGLMLVLATTSIAAMGA